MYDVAIIGVGPAGTTLARLIGQRYRVLLVDRRPLDEPGSQSIPRDPGMGRGRPHPGIPGLRIFSCLFARNMVGMGVMMGEVAEDTLIGELGFGLMHGLAYDSSTETLLGTYGESAGDGLYSIDASSGAATLIGHVGFFHVNHLNTVTGLAVHPETHVLYGVASGPAGDWSALIEIDKKTGVGTLIGEDTPHLSGLAFDMQTHILYGIDNWTGDLYSIDTGTGKATLVGSTGLGNPLGLADVAAIPEPATVCLLALGSLIFFRTARE